MKTLFFLDRKDYDLSWSHVIRHSANSVIVNENKLAMIYVAKHNYYAFPGGGIEDGETIIDALIRETKEETGFVIKPLSIVPIGKTIEIRKDRYIDEIYERHDYYYLCEVDDVPMRKNLSANEIEYGHQLVFISIDEAITANKLHMQRGFNWTEGIMCVLNALKDNATASPR